KQGSCAELFNATLPQEIAMNEAEENIIDWLRDAHAMEQQSEQLLRGEIGRLKSYPELEQQLQRELGHAHSHAELLKNRIEMLGGSTSAIKDIGARLMAFGQVASGIFVSDEVVKGAMSLYVFSNLEVASYTILVEAAGHVGDTQTRDLCQQIL